MRAVLPRWLPGLPRWLRLAHLSFLGQRHPRLARWPRLPSPPRRRTHRRQSFILGGCSGAVRRRHVVMKNAMKASAVVRHDKTNPRLQTTMPTLHAWWVLCEKDGLVPEVG